MSLEDIKKIHYNEALLAIKQNMTLQKFILVRDGHFRRDFVFCENDDIIITDNCVNFKQKPSKTYIFVECDVTSKNSWENVYHITVNEAMKLFKESMSKIDNMEELEDDWLINGYDIDYIIEHSYTKSNYHPGFYDEWGDINYDE